jgi:hypothetical protein
MTTWQDTVMSRERRKELIVARSRQQHVPESQEDMLLTKQAQLSFEAGEQSKARLIADLQETVNRMMADNSELVVKLEHERQEGRREAIKIIEYILPTNGKGECVFCRRGTPVDERLHHSDPDGMNDDTRCLWHPDFAEAVKFCVFKEAQHG